MVNSAPDRKLILLVEDDKEAQELVAFILEEYNLICARDFDEGLRLASRRYFDLYILDNWLTDKSGVELCRAIREFDPPHTPIMFYSAAAYARDIGEGIRAGAQVYLVKPIIPDELRRTIAHLISAARKAVFEARRAESAAILEELVIRKTENAVRMEKAKKKCLRAEKNALRVAAEIALLAAGGARGDFAREWLSVFLEEARLQLYHNRSEGRRD